MKSYIVLTAMCVLGLSTIIAQDLRTRNLRMIGPEKLSIITPGSGAGEQQFHLPTQGGTLVTLPPGTPAVGATLVVTEVHPDGTVILEYSDLEGVPTSVQRSGGGAATHVTQQFPRIPANSFRVITLNIANVLPGSVIAVSPTTQLPGMLLIGDAWVSAPGVVLVKVVNPSAGAIDANRQTLAVAVVAPPPPKDARIMSE